MPNEGVNVEIRINTLSEFEAAYVTIEVMAATPDETAHPSDAGAVADLEIQLGLAQARIVELEDRLNDAVTRAKTSRESAWAETARADAAESEARSAQGQLAEMIVKVREAARDQYITPLARLVKIMEITRR